VATRRCGVCPTECSTALRAAWRSTPSKKGDLSNVGTSEKGSQRTLIIRTRGGKEVSSDRSQPRQEVRCGKGREQRKEKAMLARFDHRPMLTAVLALSTTVLVVVVITLSALLITASQQAATSSSVSEGGNRGAGAAPANMDAGGENYGYDIYHQRDTWEAVRKERMERLEK